MDGRNLHLGPFEAFINKFKTAHLKRTLQKKTAENDWKKIIWEKKKTPVKCQLGKFLFLKCCKAWESHNKTEI